MLKSYLSGELSFVYFYGNIGIRRYGHENEMYNVGLNLKEVECL